MLTAHKISPDILPEFIFAGKAILTFQSVATERHFTYKISQHKTNTKLFFVNLLTGPDRYSYLGILNESDKPHVKTTAKSCASSEAISVKAINWVLQNLKQPKALEQVVIRHEGYCARCGRQLTEPESIESGFGPYCRSIKNKK